MADGSTIEWLARPGTKPATWNPIRAVNKKTGRLGWHCVHMNEACRFCYAERMNLNPRNLPFGGTGLPFKPGHLSNGNIEVFLDDKVLLEPLFWSRPRTIFPCSMTDLHGEWVKQEWLDRIYAVMALTPQHDYLVLTKRAPRRREYLTDANVRGVICDTARDLSAALRRNINVDGMHATWPLPNVWHGSSASDQLELECQIGDVIATPAAVRFISLEPLLAPIDLRSLKKPGIVDPFDALVGATWSTLRDGSRFYSGAPRQCDVARLNWIIVGGESGPNARPMHPDWARSLRDQCAAAGVAFFFKQWGRFAPTRDSGPPEPGDIRKTGDRMVDVGKKRSGRLLDGREHSEWPFSPAAALPSRAAMKPGAEGGGRGAAARQP